MTEPLALDQPTYYRILIHGHLTPGWSQWFAGLAISTGYDETGQPVSTLAGLVRDQAELHGIIIRIRDLGLPLLLVEQGEPTTPENSNEPTDDSG